MGKGEWVRRLPGPFNSPIHRPAHQPSNSPTHPLNLLTHSPFPIRPPSESPQRHRLLDLPVDEWSRIALVREPHGLAFVEELTKRDAARVGDDGLAAAHERGGDRVGDEGCIAMLV